MVNAATIILWNKNVGAVLWDESRQFSIIEFEQSFIKRALDISPLMMPLTELQNGNTLFSFPFRRSKRFVMKCALSFSSSSLHSFIIVPQSLAIL